MPTHTSKRRRLAEGRFVSVEACECGVLHVSLGPLTLRLQAEVVESVWLTLGEALTQLAVLPRDPRVLTRPPAERPS